MSASRCRFNGPIVIPLLTYAGCTSSAVALGDPSLAAQAMKGNP